MHLLEVGWVILLRMCHPGIPNPCYSSLNSFQSRASPKHPESIISPKEGACLVCLRSSRAGWARDGYGPGWEAVFTDRRPVAAVIEDLTEVSGHRRAVGYSAAFSESKRAGVVLKDPVDLRPFRVKQRCARSAG